MSKVPITPEMLNLISAIDIFKGMWPYHPAVISGALGPIRMNVMAQTIGAALRFEGMNADDNNIYQFLTSSLTSIGGNIHEDAIKGLVFTLDNLNVNSTEFLFFPDAVRKIHKHLMQFSSLNYPDFTIDEDLEDLLTWTRNQLSGDVIHPLLIIGIFMVVFLSIDPYQVGQIRLAHCLGLLLFDLAGYGFVFYGALVSFFEKDKDAYTNALLATQESLSHDAPHYTPWLVFFLRSLKDLTMELRKTLEEQLFESKGTKGLSERIVTLLHVHNNLSISQFAVLTGVNRNTLKKKLATLCEDNIIQAQGVGKSTRYICALMHQSDA